MLPLNWEDSTEEVSKAAPGAAAVSVLSSSTRQSLNAQEQQMMDLLELPVYTQSSLRAVDEQGANAAVSRHGILRAVAAEEFYAVHSKAQRRVPVPSELHLDEPFNARALDKLLSVEIPEDLHLNSLSLVYQPSQQHLHMSGIDIGFGSSRGSDNIEENRFAGQFGESVSVNDYSRGGSSSGGAGGSGGVTDHSTITSGYTTRHSASDGDVFMLGGGAHGKGHVDIIPLSKILGDTFEDSDVRGGGKSQKSRRKSDSGGRSRKSRRSKGGGGINTVEMVPAGAVDSDAEDDDEVVAAGGRKGGNKGSKSSSKKGSRKSRTHDDDDDDNDEDEVS